jgi:hypothetical protein
VTVRLFLSQPTHALSDTAVAKFEHAAVAHYTGVRSGAVAEALLGGSAWVRPCARLHVDKGSFEAKCDRSAHCFPCAVQVVDSDGPDSAEELNRVLLIPACDVDHEINIGLHEASEERLSARRLAAVREVVGAQRDDDCVRYKTVCAEGVVLFGLRCQALLEVIWHTGRHMGASEQPGTTVAYQSKQNVEMRWCTVLLTYVLPLSQQFLYMPFPPYAMVLQFAPNACQQRPESACLGYDCVGNKLVPGKAAPGTSEGSRP